MSELLHDLERLVEIVEARGERSSSIVARHDRESAPAADAAFVASSLQDARQLAAALAGRVQLGEGVLTEIERRRDSATAGPWACYIEADGGLGGCNVITMAGSEADLYLWQGDRLAADDWWRLVAGAHEQIPGMILELRNRNLQPGS